MRRLIHLWIGNPAAEHIELRTPRPVNTDKAFEIARSWIDNCIHHDEQYHNAEISVLPTRVLDIRSNGGHDTVRLHVNKSGEVGPYVALSYWWVRPGFSEPRRTTSSVIRSIFP